MEYDELVSEVDDRDVFEWVLDRYPESIMITAGPAHERPEEEILFVNKCFERMTGYSRAETIGETPTMLQGAATSEYVIGELGEKLSEADHFVGETVNYRKDGEAYRVRWSVDPIEPDDGSGVTHWVSIQRDVSDDALATGFL